LSWFALGLALCGLLASPSPLRAEEIDERVPAAPGGRLVVDVDLGIGLRPDRGRVEVSTHAAEEVRVVASTSGWASGSVRVNVAPEPAGVRVDARVEGALSWLFGGPHVELRVFVPERTSVDLRTTAGPVRVTGVRGSVRVRVDDGDVELRGSEGDAKLRTLRGAVEVSGLAGDLEVKTSDGAIEIEGVRGDVRARTTAGSIDAQDVEGSVSARAAEGDVELADVRGPVEARTGRGVVRTGFAGPPQGALETAEGDLEVSFPTRAAADLDARGGALEIGAGVEFAGEQGPAHAVGTLAGGGAPLWLRAERGRIRLSPR
jgi:hypothetical protein